jgi:uncharacterized membrane protein
MRMEPERDPAGDAIESVESIVGLYEKNGQAGNHLQSAIDHASDFAGRSVFVAMLISAIILWLLYNLLAHEAGLRPFDKPPFAWLELSLTLIALLLAAVIVATQRREDRLADRRARLTLQLALLSEKKNAKIIALLEEIRRDSPALANRIDPESDALSAPADPKAILSHIDRDIGKPPSE